MTDRTASRRIWGWYFFDWASQPYNTLLLTFIFGPYFASIVSQRMMADGLESEAAGAYAQSIWSLGLTVSGLSIALLAPFLGAMADASGRRMPWIWGFSALYVAGSAVLWFAYPDASNFGWILVAFGIGIIGMEFATIFTNALLPDLGDHGEIGNISGTGFAFGYLGGVLALAIMLLLFEDGAGRTIIGLQPLFGLDPAANEGTRFVGPFTALWYVASMAVFFLWVRETGSARRAESAGVAAALNQLKTTVLSLKRRISLASYLGSSLFYRDALNGLYGFGGVYATLVLGWSITQIGIFGIFGALTATIFSWLGGKADRRYGPKPVIVISIVILIIVCIIIVGMTREQILGIPLIPGSAMPDIVFYLCGGTIGAAGGTLQASSRSMMVRHSRPERATEAFGLYALSGKATAFLAPALIGLATWFTGSPRLGVSPLIGLFLLGLILLFWVKPEGDPGPE